MITANITSTNNINTYSARIRVHGRERVGAAVRAMNRGMTKARVHAARLIHNEYGRGLTIGDIKKRAPIKRASQFLPAAHIAFSGRRVSLVNKFGMRRIGRWGVAFRRLPWRLETIAGEEVSPAMLDRAFLQRGRRGPAVFTRTGKERYPITILVAPGVAEVYRARRLQPGTVSVLQSEYQKVFLYEMDRKLRAAVGQNVRSLVREVMR